MARNKTHPQNIKESTWAYQFENMDDFEKGYMSALYDMAVLDNIVVKGGKKAILISKVFKLMDRINTAVRARKDGVYCGLTSFPSSMKYKLVPREVFKCMECDNEVDSEKVLCNQCYIG